MEPRFLSRRKLFAVAAYTQLAFLTSCSENKQNNQDAGSTDNDRTLLGPKTLEALIANWFPLNGVPSIAYKQVADEVWAESESDSEFLQTIANIQQKLDETAGGDWLSSAQVHQREAMAHYENDPWFAAFQFRAHLKFFERKDVWQSIGYQGPSVEQGGYINRGFNDISWLPETEND